MLDAKTPGINSWGETVFVERPQPHWRPDSACDQSGADAVDIPRRERRRVEQWRIPEPVKVIVVLADALIKHAEPAADGRLALPKGVPGETQSGRPLILAMLREARRYSRG